MLGMVSTYNQEEHSLIGGEIGNYIERLGEKAQRDLAVIRYNNLGVFCIIEFMSPHRDVHIDIMNLGKSLGNFTRGKAQELRQRLFKPLTCDETSRQLAEQDSDYHHWRQDENEAEHEREARLLMEE
jgi:hypothetical protein